MYPWFHCSNGLWQNLIRKEKEKKNSTRQHIHPHKHITFTSWWTTHFNNIEHIHTSNMFAYSTITWLSTYLIECHRIPFCLVKTFVNLAKPKRTHFKINNTSLSTTLFYQQHTSTIITYILQDQQHFFMYNILLSTTHLNNNYIHTSRSTTLLYLQHSFINNTLQQ